MDMCHVWICLEIIFHPPPNEPGNHRYGKTSCWSQPIHLRDCFFLSLRLFNWCSNICWRECNIPIFFSETTVYYENGSRGGKILRCSFLNGKRPVLQCDQNKIHQPDVASHNWGPCSGQGGGEMDKLGPGWGSREEGDHRVSYLTRECMRVLPNLHHSSNDDISLWHHGSKKWIG